MDILTACKGALSSQSLALYRTAITWIVGREYLRAAYGSTANSLQLSAIMSAWDAALTEIVASVQNGASGPSTDQLTAMQAIILDAGSQYLGAVTDAISSAPVYPPGMDPNTCAVDWRTFACFCNWLAQAFISYNPQSSDPQDYATALTGSNWDSYSCGADVGTDPAYSGALVPKGPGGKPPTSSLPPGGRPPATKIASGGGPTVSSKGPGGTSSSNQTSGGTTQTNWTPWIIGGAAVVLLGIVGSVMLSSPRPTGPASSAPAPSANPRSKKGRGTRRYGLAELKAMPTITVGHFDNLKVETPTMRVWLSRMTKEDGAPYNNQVTVEELRGGIWRTVDEYQAR